VQLAEDQGQGDGQRRAEDNHYRVIRNGVADDKPDVAVGKEIFEIIQADPRAADNAFQKTARNPVLLKRDNNAEHGQIAEQQIPYGCRQRQ